jgi:hypothetical protein
LLCRDFDRHRERIHGLLIDGIETTSFLSPQRLTLECKKNPGRQSVYKRTSWSLTLSIGLDIIQQSAKKGASMMGKFQDQLWQSMSLIAAFVCALNVASSTRGSEVPWDATLVGGQQLHVVPASRSCTGENREASDAASRRAIESSNAFGLDLYQKIGKSVRGNLAFSPINIEMVLAMTYAGAGSGTETERQMARVLHLDPAEKQLHPGFKALLDSLESEKRKSGLKLANRVWVQQGLLLQPAFTELMNSTYRAGFSQPDFAKADSRQVINSWTAQQTEGKIKDWILAIQLDKTTHQAFVDVREQGTEEAAGTSTSVKSASVHPVFRADRPILSFIRESAEPSGAILSMGRFTGPK